MANSTWRNQREVQGGVWQSAHIASGSLLQLPANKEAVLSHSEQRGGRRCATIHGPEGCVGGRGAALAAAAHPDARPRLASAPHQASPSAAPLLRLPPCCQQALAQTRCQCELQRACALCRPYGAVLCYVHPSCCPLGARAHAAAHAPPHTMARPSAAAAAAVRPISWRCPPPAEWARAAHTRSWRGPWCTSSRC